MLKYLIVCLFLFQVLSLQKRVRINYIDQIVLNHPLNGQNITVQLSSLPGNDPTIPVTVQLRQINNPSNPLDSTQTDSQTCTFTNKTCKIQFVAPTINSGSNYTVRLVQSSAFHNLGVRILTNNTHSKRLQSTYRNIQFSPEGVTNPGFKFYNGATGTWSVSFNVSSYPAPTISEYIFTLWEVNGNQLTSVASQSFASAGQANFTITTANFYYLSFELQISNISSTDKYPIEVSFTYEDDLCPSGDYFNRTIGNCEPCQNVVNATGNSTNGSCQCNSNYFWSPGQSICRECPKFGCPQKVGLNNLNDHHQSHGEFPRVPVTFFSEQAHIGTTTTTTEPFSKTNEKNTETTGVEPSRLANSKIQKTGSSEKVRGQSILVDFNSNGGFNLRDNGVNENWKH